MAWGKTPTTTTESPLATNQVFISSVAVPNHANGDLTALEGGPASTDGNGNETAPAGMYVKDGGNVTQGAIADVAVTSDTPGSVSAKLRGLVKILASAWDSVHGRLIVDGSQVTQPVSGTVTETNSGSINTHLANIDSDSASLVTNTTGLATQATLSAAKANLDTIVTNTNKIPASPAQEGGNLATIAGAISAGKMQTNVTNANPNGQATMANSAPVVLASDQMIDLAMTNAIRNGQGHQAGSGKLVSATNTNVIMGMGIFNNSTAKNFLIYSIKVVCSAALGSGNQINLTTVDPAFGNPVTPVNSRAGGAASVATVSIPNNNLASSVSETGTMAESFFIGANVLTELLTSGSALLLPANAANGVAVYVTMPAAGNGYSCQFKWIEY